MTPSCSKITLACLLIILGACSASQLIHPAERSCKEAIIALKKRIGPELGKLGVKLPLPLSKQSFGCALTFNRIEEELPGEVAGIYGQSSSQELAVYLPDAQGLGSVTVLPPPGYREEGVRLELKLMELHPPEPTELVVIERPLRTLSRYKALRAYMFAEGVPSPREIFSESLRLKTVDGIIVTADWSFETFEKEEAIVVKGGGDYRLYKWHEGLQSFKLDLAASARYKQGTPSSL